MMLNHPKVRFYPQAKIDLAEILAHLREEASAQLAQAFLDAVGSATGRLVDHPGLGVRRSYRSLLLQNVRMVSLPKFSRHLLFYRSQDGVIQVIRLIHGARDVDALFSGS